MTTKKAPKRNPELQHQVVDNYNSVIRSNVLNEDA
jgi:hypothetical protein